MEFTGHSDLAAVKPALKAACQLGLIREVALTADEARDAGFTASPACALCSHSSEVPGNAHIRCLNLAATVLVDRHGYRNGWAFWPFLFDPVWVIACDGNKPGSRSPETIPGLPFPVVATRKTEPPKEKP